MLPSKALQCQLAILSSMLMRKVQSIQSDDSFCKSLNSREWQGLQSSYCWLLSWTKGQQTSEAIWSLLAPTQGTHWPLVGLINICSCQSRLTFQSLHGKDTNTQRARSVHIIRTGTSFRSGQQGPDAHLCPYTYFRLREL